MYKLFQASKTKYSDGGVVISAVSSYGEGGTVTEDGKVVGSVTSSGDTEEIEIPADVSEALFGDVDDTDNLEAKDDKLGDTTLTGAELKAPDPITVENNKSGDTTLTGATTPETPEPVITELETDNSSSVEEFKKGGSAGNWIQEAIHHSGRVINKAKELNIIKEGEKLTKKKLHEMRELADKWEDSANWKHAIDLAERLKEFKRKKK